MKKTKVQLKKINGSIVAPKGFLTSGVFCDIKRLGTGKGSNKEKKRDLTIVLSIVPATVAGMFTTNQVCAAPVKISVPRASKERAQAVVINSGNANACTGAQGHKDALAMTELVSKTLRIPVEDVLVCSTGRIGVTLPMANVKRGITAACRALDTSSASAAHAAEAIMTSDTHAKAVAVELTLGGKKVRIGGICKGAGMIQPGMSPKGPRSGLHATMLSVITTDAEIASAPLKQALRIAVEQSFNRITVDGDMSTNDSVIVLANGMADNKPIESTRGSDFAAFQLALNAVTLELARMIVQDGEGVSRFITINLTGASSTADAEQAARAVANSALVKTSWCGGDPNWGRILGALGYSSAKIEEKKLSVGYSKPGDSRVLYALKNGKPASTSLNNLRKVVKAKEFDLHINLNLGKGSSIVYTADLTEEYVDFNKGE